MWARFRQRLSACTPSPPVLVHVYVLLMLTSDLLVPMHCLSHTWSPKDVVQSEELSFEIKAFAGDAKEIDYFKVLLQEGDYILVGGRNKVHNISMKTMVEDEDRLLEWKPKSMDIPQCENKLKASLKSKCQNFIQVLGKMNNGQLYVCGTNAFKPTCRVYEYKEADYPVQIPEYISSKEEKGVGKCPYSPEHNSTAIYTGDKLYSATFSDFLAIDPLIMESEHRIRTQQHDSNILNDPNFVNSFEIDDMIYFFFREKAVENLNCGKATFSRVARVCKQDMGSRIERFRWTSFFKARLNCSIDGEIPFSFDELQSTSNFTFGNHQPTKDPADRRRMFYGVFTTPENSIHGSAVCAFMYDDIVNAFKGKFKSQQTVDHRWMAVSKDKTPVPHPSESCVNDSKTLPEEQLGFIRQHPLMDSAVNAVGGGPILFQTGTQGRFTAIAIDWQVLGNDLKYYDVMFVGTSDGRVLKAINTGKDGKVDNVVIEDIQVLGKNEAVRELRIYSDSEKLIVVSQENVVSIPLHRCHRHKMCGDCVAIQDPYCAWHQEACTTHINRGIQDIEFGDTSKCPDGGKREKSIVVTIPPPTTTEKPAEKVACPACSCNCNKTEPALVAENKTQSGDGTREMPEPEDGVVVAPSTAQKCAPEYIAVRSDDQVFTASTLAIACVVSIVVAVLIGFLIGYRVSLCRNHTRNTEQMINYEQNFGSLRKNPNRHSIEASHNFYSDPNVVQKPYKIQNVLVSNNITQKNPNLPNGSIESKTVSAKQAAKTYL